MTSSPIRILLADKRSSWCSSFEAALMEEGYDVRVTTDVDPVYDAFVSPAPGTDAVQFVILAEELNVHHDRNLIHEIWQKMKTRGERRSDWPVKYLVFLTELPISNAIVKNMLRQRGVTGYICREAPLAQSVAHVGRLIYGDRRQGQRYFVKWHAHVIAGKTALQGTVVDISETGCQVILARSQKAERLPLNSEVELALVRVGSTSTQELRCRAVIKRSRQLKTLFRSRTSLGLLFLRDNASEPVIGELVQLARASEGSQGE